MSTRPQTVSQRKKYFLLVVFCFVQFLDAFNFSALFAALPHIQKDLDMTDGETSWIISAFQLTFASFLLLSGRLSDVFNAKYAFVLATTGIGCMSLATGFLNEKISFIVFRAIGGIMGAMTIPSALTLLVSLFPEPHEQAQAIGAFGGSGGVGNVLGLLIGAILVKVASWRWIFWFITIVALPIAGLSALLVPGVTATVPNTCETPKPTLLKKLNSLDLGGITLLTVAVVLFIFGLTEGSSGAWATVKVLLPLILSIFLVGGFLLWERVIPSHIAAIPPRTWFCRNFAVLFAVALLPYLWFTTMFDVNMILWQDVYGWNSLYCALRMIPSGVVTFSMSLTGPLAKRICPKWIILFGMVCMIVANILFAFADGPDKYFQFSLPAIIIGDAGAMLVYTHANIAIFETTPSNMAGTVGAIFNGALQLGSAVGIAAVSAIQTSVESKHGDEETYAGRAAAWWFLVAVVAVEAIAVVFFYRTGSVSDESADTDVSQDEKASTPSDFDMEKVVPPLPVLALEGSTPQTSEMMIHSMAGSEVTLAGPHDSSKHQRPKPPRRDFSSYATVVNA